MDTDKLLKILSLTTSSNDGEALNAIRRANSMLKNSDKTWKDVLLKSIPSSIEPFLYQKPPNQNQHYAAYNNFGLGAELHGMFDNIFGRKI